MPIQFGPTKDMTPLQFLGGLPTPLTIGGDVEELINAFLPLSESYKQQLLEAPIQSLERPGARSYISSGLKRQLKNLPTGIPGLSDELMKVKNYMPDMPEIADMAHVFRGDKGNPIGYLSHGGPGSNVHGIAIDEAAPAIQKSRALLQLARKAIENRLQPGMMTNEGKEMLEKIRLLASKYLK